METLLNKYIRLKDLRQQKVILQSEEYKNQLRNSIKYEEGKYGFQVSNTEFEEYVNLKIKILDDEINELELIFSNKNKDKI